MKNCFAAIPVSIGKGSSNKNKKDIKSLAEGELREMLRKAVEGRKIMNKLCFKDELKRRDSDNTKEL